MSLEFLDVFEAMPGAPEYPYAYDAADVPTVYNPPSSPIYDVPPSLVGEPPMPGQSGGFNVGDIFRGVTPLLSAGASAAVGSFITGFANKRPDSKSPAVAVPSRWSMPPMPKSQAGNAFAWMSSMALPLVVFVFVVMFGAVMLRHR